MQCLLLVDRKLALQKAIGVLWGLARPRDLFLTAEMVAVNTFRDLGVSYKCQIEPIVSVTMSVSGFVGVTKCC